MVDLQAAGQPLQGMLVSTAVVVGGHGEPMWATLQAPDAPTPAATAAIAATTAAVLRQSAHDETEASVTGPLAPFGRDPGQSPHRGSTAAKCRRLLNQEYLLSPSRPWQEA